MLALNDDPQLGLWNLDDHSHPRKLAEAQAAHAKAIAFSHSGTTLARGRTDGQIELLSVDRALELCATLTYPADLGSVDNIAFAPDDRLLAAAFSDGYFVLWDMASREWIGRFSVGNASDPSLAFSPDGKKLVSTGAHIDVWQLNLDAWESSAKQMMIPEVDRGPVSEGAKRPNCDMKIHTNRTTVARKAIH
jgi:WD40 repeat protein